MRARRWGGVLLAVVTALGALGGARFHRVPSQRHCGVPNRDYQFVRTSPPVSALSFRAVLVQQAPAVAIPAVAGAGPAVAIKSFQLAQSSVGIDQCVISLVSLTLHEDGVWLLSLRADQNPPLVEAPGITPVIPDELRLAVRQTGHIKRNEFFVRVSCFGPTPRGFAGPDLTARPLLLVLQPQPFWVQNGQPRKVDFEGRAEHMGRFFEAIDRVEVDLSYR
jgi:hypothetical protein